MTETELISALPKDKAGLFLRHNQHKSYYQSATDYLSGTLGNWKDEESKSRAIETNEIWELQWYPDTPVGFVRAFAPTLSELLAFVKEITQSTSRPPVSKPIE